jgi:Ca-activated chloride channel family protein
MISFESSWVLCFLLIIPILFYIYKKIILLKKKQAIKFSNISFMKSSFGNNKKSNKMNILFYLSLFILLIMIVGLANPQVPLKNLKKGVSVVLVMDVSGSMQADDYKPNRLESSKSSAEILIKSLKENDHVGIVTFESGATTAAYLSPYKERVLEKLKNINLKDGATAIGDGLSLGIDMALSIPNKKKVVILLSDGVNNSGVISIN